MNTKAVAFGLVIALVLTVSITSALSNSDGGDWGHYKEIWIKENSGTSLSDYQVLVALEPSNFPDKAKSDGSDLRFTEEGEELSYWVEEYNVSARTARIWVEVQSIPANGEAKVKMYYGNPSASGVSSTTQTFINEISGIVESLHFDEGSGSIAEDTSGNGNDGTVYGSIWVDGKFGKALQFDGQDDYVEVHNTDRVFDLVSSWTLEAWVNPFTAGWDNRNDPIVWKIARNGWNEDTFYLGWDSGNIFVGSLERASDDKGFEVASTAHLPNQWYHVVGTYDGTDLKIYVNGTLEGDLHVGSVTAYTGSAPLRIGNILNSDHANKGVFDGIIDEVRIYDQALSAKEISDLYNNYGFATLNYSGRILVRKYTSAEPTISLSQEYPTDYGLVAEWHFDEGSGNIVTDSSENGNDGFKYGATWTTGVSEKALEFDGVDDYVEVPDSQSLDITNAITIEAWVKRTRFDDLDIILEKGGDWKFGETNYGMGLHALSHNNMFYFFFKGGWRGVRGVSDFNWHHYTVVATNGATNPDMYIDGELKSIEYTEGATTITLFPSTRNLHIGAQVDQAYTYYGANIIDEIRIYNRTLTSTEIKKHYEENKPAEELSTKQKIIFTSDRSGNSDIWMMDPDGTNLEQLTTNSSADTSPQISPDGTKIAFLSDRTGTWQVWLMNTDGSNHYQLFDVKELPIQYEYEKRVNYPTWAPDGSYLITHIELVGEVHSAPWAAIYRHDPDGSNPQLFLDWGPSINGKFSISNDGRKFAYCREDSSYWTPTLKISVGNIVEGVVDETSINNLNVTIDGLVDEDVVWFSNGNKLMWSKSNNSEGYGIPQNLYSMNIDETDIKKLTAFTDKYARMPDFVPDEQKVVFTISNETTAGIYIMNANGSGVQALLVDDYKNSGPCWGDVVLPSSYDFFVTGDTKGNVYIFPSYGNGSFADKELVGNISDESMGPAIADFDNDGDFDFTLQSNDGKSYLFINDGTGNFTKMIVAEGLSLHVWCEEAATADFNNDGYYDYIVPSSGSYIYLFTNNKNNTFSKSTISAEWFSSHFLAGIDAGDFNEDGNLDFLIAWYGANIVYLYIGNGDGTFTYKFAFDNTAHSGSDIYAVVAGDFDNDGHLDAIVGQDDDGDPGQTWRYNGDGTGNFTYSGEAYDVNPSVESGSEYSGSGFADAYDFDEDGNLDVVASAEPAGGGDYGTFFFKGNGDGTFQTLVKVDDFIGRGISAPPLEVTSTKTINIFDTGEGTYPSIKGTHNGTIKPSHNFTVNGMYTYPCAGTGGHTESIELYENGILIANGSWNGWYFEDNQNVTLHNVTGASYVTLLKGHAYNYTIKTGSYPQIIHKQNHITLDGSVITCTEFIDVNGNRYDDWIPAIALTPADAVLILNFDEGSGTIAKDESGYGNDGTIYGAKWVDGKYGKALEFDGVDDYVEFETPVDNTPPFSVEVWVKPTTISPSKQGSIISNGGETGASYGLFLGLEDRRGWLWTGRDSLGVGGGAFTPPTSTGWTHLVGVWDGSRNSDSVKLYVNGELSETATPVVDEAGNANNLRIGAYGFHLEQFFSGTIDDVAIYSRALTSEEIKRHYEG